MPEIATQTTNKTDKSQSKLYIQREFDPAMLGKYSPELETPDVSDLVHPHYNLKGHLEAIKPYQKFYQRATIASGILLGLCAGALVASVFIAPPLVPIFAGLSVLATGLFSSMFYKKQDVNDLVEDAKDTIENGNDVSRYYDLYRSTLNRLNYFKRNYKFWKDIAKDLRHENEHAEDYKQDHGKQHKHRQYTHIIAPMFFKDKETQTAETQTEDTSTQTTPPLTRVTRAVMNENQARREESDIKPSN